MTLTRKGILLAVFQCLLVLSLSGKLLYDRATRPRVWVKTVPWDPSLPIRGRYLSLRLVPENGAQWYNETAGKQVLFFVPEHTIPLEEMRRAANAPELWAEVTIPRKGPPRPIQLGLKRDGRIEPVKVK